MANVSFRDIQVTSSEIEIRKIGLGDLRQALHQGYEDFTAKPSFVAFLFLIYPLFALLLTLFAVGENLLYLAFPMVAGFTLLGPAISIGLFEISRRREKELDTSWRSAFEFVHSASFAPIAALSILMMLLYLAWLYMAQLIFFGLFGGEPTVPLSDVVAELFSTRRGAALLMYGTGVGFLFAFIALAFSVFAFPLLLDKPTSTVTAIVTSMKAVTHNPVTMAVWGLIVATLLAAGAALLLVGLAAVLPILGHATWHLYRKVVVP